MDSRAVKFAIISDIHSNAQALEAVLAAGEAEGVGEYLCLGDVVGYGGNPNECCENVFALEGRCIAGNHDLAAVGKMDLAWFSRDAAAGVRWSKGALQEIWAEKLAALESRASLGFCQMCHGSPRSADEYLMDAVSAKSAFRDFSGQVCFFGHTHLPSYFRLDEARGEVAFGVSGGEAIMHLDSDARYLVNPGSVGQPRDDDPRAAYLVWDLAENTVAWKRVEYDVKGAQEAIRRAHLPSFLAERLAGGY